MSITRHDVTATMTLPAGWHPTYGAGYFRRAPEPVWADPTDTVGYQGWTGPTTDATSVVTEANGVRVIETRLQEGAAGTAYIYRQIPVLPPGLYRVSAYLFNAGGVAFGPSLFVSATGATVTVVAGMTDARVSTAGYAEAWSFIQVTGTASQMSAQVGAYRLTNGGTGALTMRVSGFSVTPVTYAEVLDLRPTAATITLDESWTPYARASLTCPVPQDDVLDRIDPRTPTRVRLSIARSTADAHTVADLDELLAGTLVSHWSATFAGPPPWTVARLSQTVGAAYESPPRPDLDRTPRTFDLMLRSRSVDWLAGTMTLELTSDEMALQDFARWEEITTRFTPPPTTSLATLVNWGLGHLGWTLAPSARDAVIDSSSVIWNLGEELWDFLDAHVRAANRRLWCDENRNWRLTEPFTGTTGAPVTVDAPTSLTDTLTRTDGYSNSNVVIFSWTDAEGIQRRAYSYADWASHLTPMQPVTIVHRRENTVGTVYQAAEMSEGLRRRSATRGRAVHVEAVADPAVTPGAPLIVAGRAAQVRDAMVSSVTWSYPADVMTIRTRDAATT